MWFFFALGNFKVISTESISTPKDFMFEWLKNLAFNNRYIKLSLANVVSSFEADIIKILSRNIIRQTHFLFAQQKNWNFH